ncbi:MAG: helix-turn-helix transcriptional regulator, partial [Oscillospiraceae bacterium]|nr:helix-turn-helix transcriptional regulator [Oscillospiraceae bacterium]
MSFGSRLRERREALGLKQSELGKMLGVTGSAIGNYENGVSFPKADVLYRVFDALDCDANYLYRDEMNKQDSS